MSRFILFIVACIFVSCTGVTVKTEDNFEFVELPDHSLVYLNHNSSIKYNEDFNPRDIALTGEAFFDVTASDSPFIVTTALGEIKVTGTEFNVAADEEVLDVEVEEGSVAIEIKEGKERLARGQRAAYQKSTKTMKKVKADRTYKKWMYEMEAAFIKLGKEFKRSGKKIGKESKKLGRALKNKLKDL